jgi:hypothetical protein
MPAPERDALAWTYGDELRYAKVTLAILLKRLREHPHPTPEYIWCELQNRASAHFPSGDYKAALTRQPKEENEDQERHDCPIHGSGEGKDCPRC